MSATLNLVLFLFKTWGEFKLCLESVFMASDWFNTLLADVEIPPKFINLSFEPYESFLEHVLPAYES